MSLLASLSEPSAWEEFYEYKRSLACPKAFTESLRAFIDGRRYLPVCAAIERGDPFPLPRKAILSKLGSEKKRVVYTYPDDENTVLKLLTYRMLRTYDGLFDDALFSFRPGRTAKDAVRRLLRVPDLTARWAYKADVHDYFNSVPIPQFLPMLRAALADDAPLYGFLSALLTESRVRDRGAVVTEEKGIMAGTPLSSFYANLCLADLDRHFTSRGVLYARYSDDILLFAPTRQEAEAHAGTVHAQLAAHGLTINPAKECFFAPGEGFTFLGFSCLGDRVDIAPATVEKLKQKMRRKRDALRRWQTRSEAEPERAARAFLRVFNRKLLESPRDNELSWSRWFFPVISTADSLGEIDRYAQDCLRYLLSGTHTKARYNVRYADLKALGYRSLVHEYYAHRENEKTAE